MKCSICGVSVDSVDAVEQAINNDWIPYFYEGDQEHEFACDGCSETLLELGKDGEMEVKQEFRGNVMFQPGKPPAQKGHLIMGIIFK